MKWRPRLRSRAGVLLVCDRPNWAYDAIARALVRYNPDPDLHLDIFYLKGREGELARAVRRSDLAFFLGWQLLGDFDGATVTERLPWLDPSRVLTGIHSHHSWDGRRTTPESSVAPPAALVDFLARYRGVNAVSRRLSDLFAAAGLEKVRYTANGVDTELFRPSTDIALTGPLTVGFSGSKKHDWRKGISELIEPATDVPGIEVRLAMPVDGHYVSLEQMPGFYNQLDVYVCASSSEGFSLSVLEAGASGRPIVSTRVGGCEDLVEDGRNGFLVDRAVGGIQERLVQLRDDRRLARRMGMESRRLVEERWSWQLRAPDWIDFIRSALAS